MFRDVRFLGPVAGSAILRRLESTIKCRHPEFDLHW